MAYRIGLVGRGSTGVGGQCAYFFPGGTILAILTPDSPRSVIKFTLALLSGFLPGRMLAALPHSETLGYRLETQFLP